MASYMHMLGSVSPSLDGAKRASDIVAALAPPARAGNVALVKPSETPRASITQSLKAWAPGLVGAGAGALLVPKHRVLGALGGHALAATVRPILTGRGRKRALCQLAVEGAGIAGALMWSKGPWWHPVLGWMGGVAVGSLATALVPGSPARDLYDKWKSG